jgi:hypothetical protein
MIKVVIDTLRTATAPLSGFRSVTAYDSAFSEPRVLTIPNLPAHLPASGCDRGSAGHSHARIARARTLVSRSGTDQFRGAAPALAAIRIDNSRPLSLDRRGADAGQISRTSQAEPKHGL